MKCRGVARKRYGTASWQASGRYV